MLNIVCFELHVRNYSIIHGFVNFSRKMSTEMKTRELIIKTFQEHPGWNHIEIAMEAKVCRKTVSNIMKRFYLTIKF